MKINTCLTTKSFDNEFWMDIFKIFHKDLNFDCLPPKDIPVPVLLRKYWDNLWKRKENIGKEFLNPSNINIVPLQRIWEFIHSVASIYYTSESNLKDKKIISLGAGFEPCLYVFSKLGAIVVASDIYNSPKYWFPKYVEYIKKKPEVFCHYKDFKPKINFMHLNLKSKKDLANLGNFDIIYSVSSLEHIYASSFRKKKKMFKRIIEHLNEKGIFSFTTELIIKYDKTRQYKYLIKSFIIKIKIMIQIACKKTYSNIKVKDIVKSNINLKNKTFLEQIKETLFRIKSLLRYNRRYDFFTIEEINTIIKMFKKKKVNLVDSIDLKSCHEFQIKVPKYNSLYRTPISLTFSKV